MSLLPEETRHGLPVQMVTVTRVRGPQRPSVHAPSIAPR